MSAKRVVPPGARAKPPASAVMRRDPITVREDQDLWQVAQVLTEAGITGAPVVDARGNLVGVISQTDLVRAFREMPRGPSDSYFECVEEPLSSLKTLLARDVMTRELVEAPEDTPLDRLVRILLRHRVHRVLITRGRKLVGIVSTMDILKVI